MAPPSTLSWTVDVCGVPTSFNVQRFVDRTVVFVTQVQTFGTLLEARFTPPHVDGSTDAVVRTLLGTRDDAVVELAARQVLELARRACGGCDDTPVLLGLGFREGAGSIDAVRAIVASLEEHRAFAAGGSGGGDGSGGGGDGSDARHAPPSERAQ